MRLRVQFTAQLRTIAGRAEEVVELPEGSNLEGLLVHVATELCRETAGYLLAPGGGLQSSLIVAVNNRAISTHEARAVSLCGGDVVMLLPPIAGG